MEQNTLLMPFLTDNENFTLGFECGQLWEILSNGDSIENKPCHMKNLKQIEMICESYGCNYDIQQMNEEWFNLNVPPTEISIT